MLATLPYNPHIHEPPNEEEREREKEKEKERENEIGINPSNLSSAPVHSGQLPLCRVVRAA